jgi:hypothetical protein
MLNPAELLRKNQKAREQLYPIRTERPARQREHIKTPHGAAIYRKRPELSIYCVSDFLASPLYSYTLTKPPISDRPKTARSVSDRAGTDQGRPAQNPDELSRIKQAAPIGTKSAGENKKSP